MAHLVFEKKAWLKASAIVLAGMVVFVAACGGSDPTATAVPSAPQATSTPLPVPTDTPVAAVRSTPVVAAATMPPPLVIATATPRSERPTATPSPTAPPSDPLVAPGAAAARLISDSNEWAPGEEVRVHVQVFPGTLGITGAELTMSFDQNVFEASAIIPGELLGDFPLVALNEVDNAQGEAIIALARLGATDAPTETGAVATIIFQILPGATPGGGSLEIASLALANQDFEDVEEVALSGLSFTIVGR